MCSDFFVQLTDTHLTASTEEGWLALARFVQQVKAMNPLPAFVVNTGDIVFASMRIESTAEELLPIFERYQRIMAELPVPLYNAVGNHDMTQCELTSGTASYGKVLFRKFCGPRYQSFDWGDTHVVILDEWIITRNDTDDGYLLNNDIDDEQLTWLQRDLGACRKGQVVVFCVHHRIADYPALFGKLRGVLRDDLTYWEIAGCDHQNSFCRQDHWRTMTTASFCGAWWNGPCVDGSPAGYALLFRLPDGTMRSYYRGMEQPLAVAAPLPGQTVTKTVRVDAYDPENGRFTGYDVDVRSQPPGWCDLEIRAGDLRQTTPTFFAPTQSVPIAVSLKAHIEYELLECCGEIAVEWNGTELTRLSSGDIGMHRTPLQSNALCGWNTLRVTGDALLRSPRLVLGDVPVEDPRMTR